MILPVTFLLTGIFTIMMVMLGAYVSLRRRKLRVSLGDGNDDILRRRIRAHGNFIEYIPFALLALALVETGGGSVLLVSSLAITLFISRVVHAIGILYHPTVTFRVVAMVMQNTAFIVMSIWLIAKILL